MEFPKYHGHYVGIVVQNNDPQYRGRVKIFVPHVSPTVYKGWNEINKDKNFNFIGNISTNTLFASQGTFSSIISPQANISSLIVDQFTIGFSTGYILMPDIVATTVSSGIINTGLLNAAIISSSVASGLP